MYKTGKWPKKDIDHKDRIKYHNWFSNLRDRSQKSNMRNYGNPKNNTSSVKGVCFDIKAKKWLARIKINNKQKYLGRFDNFDDAVLARYEAERKAKWYLSDPNSPAQEYCIENNLIDKPIFIKVKKKTNIVRKI